MKKLAFFSTTITLILGMAFLTLSNGANATTSVEVGVTVQTVLTMSFDSNAVAINLNPGLNGTFGTGSANVTVNTNNQTGFSLNATLSSTSLSNTINSDVIQSLSATSTQDAFPANRWGYRVVDGTADQVFNPVSSTMNGIITTSSPAQNYTAEIQFGAKVDTSIVAGDYATTINFVAVANAVPGE